MQSLNFRDHLASPSTGWSGCSCGNDLSGALPLRIPQFLDKCGTLEKQSMHSFWKKRGPKGEDAKDKEGN